MNTMNALHNPDAMRSKKSRGNRGRQSRGTMASGVPLEAIPSVRVVRVPPSSANPRTGGVFSQGRGVSFEVDPLFSRLDSLASRISRISNRHTRQDEIRATIKLSQAGIKLLPELVRLAMMKDGKSMPGKALPVSRDGLGDSMSIGSQASVKSFNSMNSKYTINQEDFIGLISHHYDLEPTKLRAFIFNHIGASLSSTEIAGMHALLLRARSSPTAVQPMQGYPPGLALGTEEVLMYCYEVTMLEQQAQKRMKQNMPVLPSPCLPTPEEKLPQKTYGQACSKWLSSPHADLLRREKLRRAIRGSTDRDIVDDLSKIRDGRFDHASAIHKITSKIHDEQQLFAGAQLGRFLDTHKRKDIKDLQHDEIKELTKIALMGEKKHMAEARRLESLGLLKEASEQNKMAEASKFLGVLAQRSLSGATAVDRALRVEDSKVMVRSMVETSRVERIHKVRLKLKDANRHRLALALVPDYRESRHRDEFNRIMSAKVALDNRIKEFDDRKQRHQSDQDSLAVSADFAATEDAVAMGDFTVEFSAHVLNRATNLVVETTIAAHIKDLDGERGAVLEEISKLMPSLQAASACILQRVGKRFIVRQRIVHEEEALGDDQAALAIIVIQGIWRIAVSKMRVKKAHEARDKALLEAATVKIQLLFRSRMAKRRAQELRDGFAAEERQIAAIRIQCMVRRRSARLMIQKVQEKRQHEIVVWAALRLQCKFRYLSARRNVKALKEYRGHLLLHGTTIRIQSQFRARRSRLRVDAIRAHRNKAAVKIQAFVRGRLHHHGHVAERKEVIEAKAHNMRQLILMMKAQHYFRRFLRLNPRPINMTIVKGNDIGKQLRGGDCFPFVYMTLTELNEAGKRSQVCLRKCSVLPSQHDPEWNETFLVPAMNRDMMATFTVCSLHSGGKPTFLGQASMRLGARYRTWDEEMTLMLNPVQEYPVYNGDKEITLEKTTQPQRTPVSIRPKFACLSSCYVQVH